MKKILVIEDEKLIREQLLKILDLEKYDVKSAENGAVGLEMAKEELPDLILCDVLMPKMNGFDVLKELQKDPDTATIPFIFLTAQAAESDLRKGMVLGAEDYITKPFFVEDLLSSIKTRLEKKELMEKISKDKLDELRDKIIYSLPHELRTPLTSLYGFTDYLYKNHETVDRQSLRKITKTMKNAAERLIKLIHNYTEYSQLELMEASPDLISEVKEESIPNPAATISFTAQRIADNHKRRSDLKLRLENTPIYFDSAHLEKIVEELVDNAFKFSEEGTTVTVKTDVDEDSYSIHVANLGVGMTPAQVKNIGAYMQFDRETQEQQGAGLGLVIVQKLVKIHKGEFKIESDPGKQITFIVKLATKPEDESETE